MVEVKVANDKVQPRKSTNLTSRGGAINCPIRQKWCQSNHDCGHPLVECFKGFDGGNKQWAYVPKVLVGR